MEATVKRKWVTDPTALRVIYNLREMKNGDEVRTRYEGGEEIDTTVADEVVFFEYGWFDKGRAILRWRRKK